MRKIKSGEEKPHLRFNCKCLSRKNLPAEIDWLVLADEKIKKIFFRLNDREQKLLLLSAILLLTLFQSKFSRKEFWFSELSGITNPRAELSNGT